MEIKIKNMNQLNNTIRNKEVYADVLIPNDVLNLQITKSAAKIMFNVVKASGLVLTADIVAEIVYLSVHEKYDPEDFDY